MTAPKYQHYVPRLHLRRFVGEQPKGMVWTYDKIQGSCRPLSPENTGGQGYFYSVPLKDGTRSDEVDAFLRLIEDRAVQPYCSLVEGRIPWGRERSDFALFLATLHLRSPGMVRCLAEMKGRLLASHLNSEWSTFERYEIWLDRMDQALGTVTKKRREAYEFWKDTSRYSIAVDRLEGLRALNSAVEIAEVLEGWHWYLLEAAEGYFVTSDQPAERSTPGAGDGAFSNPLTQLSFPLTPSTCLLATGVRLGPSRQIIGSTEVAKLNDIRARYAERLIWSHLRSDRIVELAAAHKGNRLEMKFSNQDELPDIEVMRTRFGATSPDGTAAKTGRPKNP